jgi:hypothetical protein
MSNCPEIVETVLSHSTNIENKSDGRGTKGAPYKQSQNNVVPCCSKDNDKETWGL